jgi:hypothetical protein
MQRVRFIHTLRTLVAGPFAALLLLAISLWGIGREVWVARVFQNMPSTSDVGAFFRFFESAFIHTDIVVQVLCVAAVIALCWMVRDIVHGIAVSMRFA